MSIIRLKTFFFLSVPIIFAFVQLKKNMSKSQISRTLSFFTRSKNNSDQYQCKICKENGLEKFLLGKQQTNLTTHLIKCHNPVYIRKVAPQLQLPFAMKRLKKIQSFCEIITVDGRPFAWLLGTGFLHSQEDDFNELANAGFNIYLDDKFMELKPYIKKVADKIRHDIKIELKNGFVSLMLDIATKNHRSVLGISVQFVKNDETAIRTLGHIVLKKSHKARYIVDILLACLNEFDVQADHVVTITTDNAANMIAMIHQFDEYVQIGYDNETNEEDNEDDVAVPDFINDGTLSAAQIEEVSRVIGDREALNLILDDSENFNDLLAEIVGELSRITRCVFTIRCGGHTVQLMTRDALKTSGFKGILSICQHVVKKLRLDSFKEKAKEANITYKYPRLSCPTRWDSDLYMVRYSYFIKLKKSQETK